MSKKILIRPLISEKTETLSEDFSQFSFIVDKSANKIEIKNAIEKTYGVKVASVNTSIRPSKSKSRNTRSGLIKGRVSGYKKAYVKLKDGANIDFYSEQ